MIYSHLSDTLSLWQCYTVSLALCCTSPPAPPGTSSPSTTLHPCSSLMLQTLFFTTEHFCSHSGSEKQSDDIFLEDFFSWQFFSFLALLTQVCITKNTWKIKDETIKCHKERHVSYQDYMKSSSHAGWLPNNYWESQSTGPFYYSLYHQDLANHRMHRFSLKLRNPMEFRNLA